MRDWFSGRMTAFQAVDKSSILLSRTRVIQQKKPPVVRSVVFFAIQLTN